MFFKPYTNWYVTTDILVPTNIVSQLEMLGSVIIIKYLYRCLFFCLLKDADSTGQGCLDFCSYGGAKYTHICPLCEAQVGVYLQA